ncbi:MAG TPA: hypothetical protein PKE34_09680, partial [Marmoricola sp.]|nr:hypothetical protein [Marmoricola sp.]
MTSWIPLVAASFLLIAGLLIIYAWLSPDPDTAHRQRVEELNDQMSNLNKRKTATADTRLKFATQLVELGDKATKGRRSTAVTEELLVRASLPIRAGEWLVLRCITAFVATLMGWSLASHLWGAALGLTPVKSANEGRLDRLRVDSPRNPPAFVQPTDTDQIAGDCKKVATFLQSAAEWSSITAARPADRITAATHEAANRGHSARGPTSGSPASSAETPGGAGPCIRPRRLLEHDVRPPLSVVDGAPCLRRVVYSPSHRAAQS